MTILSANIVTVDVQGDIDVETAPELRSRVYAAIENHPGEGVLLDLSAMTFIDSTGLGVLVGGLKRARLFGGDLFITTPPAPLWKVFSITGLAKVFRRPDGSSARPTRNETPSITDPDAHRGVGLTG